MTKAELNSQEISILYVEDDEESRLHMREILNTAYPDIRLYIAENGNAGIKLFKKVDPDIVITDINMPLSNGIKMSTEIKELNHSTEIIVLSAYSDTKYLLQAIEIGINNYILKPINIKQLFRVIDKSLAIIRSEREMERQNNLIRKLNFELTQKQIELEMTNQSLETFSYTVAHDLRSPLVVISGYAGLLLNRNDSELDKKSKEYLDIIMREIFRMNDLIGVLLKFSVDTRKQPCKSWTCLSDIANEVKARLLFQSSGRKVDFCIADGINAFCDPGLMRIVLENLIGNAWKFSAIRDNARIEFGMSESKEEIVFFVRDNGPGFDQTEAEKLFVPFQRGQCDADVAGFGIGLATAAWIIRRHGGRIWAEGEQGQGATFFFTL